MKNAFSAVKTSGVNSSRDI